MEEEMCTWKGEDGNLVWAGNCGICCCWGCCSRREEEGSARPEMEGEAVGAAKPEGAASVAGAVEEVAVDVEADLSTNSEKEGNSLSLFWKSSLLLPCIEK